MPGSNWNNGKDKQQHSGARGILEPNVNTNNQDSALKILGKQQRRNPDWLTASFPEMEPVLSAKRNTLLQQKKIPTRQTKKCHRRCRTDAQRVTRRCAIEYWRIHFASYDTCIPVMYLGLKAAVGPSTQSLGILLQKNGTNITDKTEKLERWIEQFLELRCTCK